jgi:hypothetical protein
VGVAGTVVSTIVAIGDAVAEGVGLSAAAGMPSSAATAAALTSAVERIRRVTLLWVSAGRHSRLNPAGRVQTRSEHFSPST